MASPHLEPTPPEAEESASGLRPAARVIESAVELARAEGTLALGRARSFATHAVGSLLWMLAMLVFLQVTLVLAALSGVILRFSSGNELAFTLAATAFLSIASGALAWRSFNRLSQEDAGRSRADE